VLHDPHTSAYEETVDELVTQLSELTTPRGTPVASAVHRGDELYPNGDEHSRPDVIFDQGQGLHTSGAVGKQTVFDGPGQWRAENVRDGLFLAHGDQIEPKEEIEPISILDIAPTILYSLGLDIPEDFEWKPVPETNSNRSEVTYRPSLAGKYGEDSESSEEVRDRLADLGYLE